MKLLKSNTTIYKFDFESMDLVLIDDVNIKDDKKKDVSCLNISLKDAVLQISHKDDDYVYFKVFVLRNN
jgi:hypothetical protein